MNIRLSPASTQRRGYWLVLVVVGILGSLAGTAQASAAQWRVSGTPLSGSASFATNAPKGIKMVWESGSTRFSLEASGVESVNSSIYNSGGSASGLETLRFTGVKFSVATCAVQGSSKGVIQTLPLRTKLVSKNGKTYEQIEPNEGTTWFTFQLTKGTGSCPIAQTDTVGGMLDVEAPSIGTEQTTHEFVSSGVIASETGTGLRIGSNPLDVDGSWIENLTGPNAGRVWSAQ